MPEEALLDAPGGRDATCIKLNSSEHMVAQLERVNHPGERGCAAGDATAPAGRFEGCVFSALQRIAAQGGRLGKGKG